MPVVQVPLSEQDHKALKQYAAFLGIPMGELLARSARHNFHQQGHYCKWMHHTLDTLNIAKDKGSDKPCYGFLCFMCKHLVECRTGVYQGTARHKQEYEQLPTEEAQQVLEHWRRSTGQVDPSSD